jgi:alkylation response protein AidB-like acyl-CoA dehydrogenase
VQRSLKDTPLHMSVLANVGTIYHALTHLTFGAIALLGKSECGTSNEDEETRLRLLTPAVKAFVSDKAVAAMEECMGCLGGQGYMEENVIGRYDSLSQHFS